MAEDKKISELQENPSISGAENVVIEKSGSNFKETFLKLKDWILGFVTTAFIQTKRPIKTVNNESLEGSGNVQIDGGVTSVNGKQGDVVLTGEDIALLDGTSNPTITEYLATNKLDSVVGGANVDIDNTDPLNPVISTVPNTSAGIWNLTYLTADVENIGGSDYYKTNRDGQGTTPSATPSVSVGVDASEWFTQDFLGDPYPIQTTIPQGDYVGVVSLGMTNNTIANPTFLIEAELYLTDANGTPVDSGVIGQPDGSYGVQLIAVASTKTIEEAITVNEEQYNITAVLPSELVIPSGYRVRYRFRATKNNGVGNSTVTHLIGTEHQNYVSVPLPTFTSGVTNDDPTEFPNLATQYDVNRWLKANAGGQLTNGFNVRFDDDTTPPPDSGRMKFDNSDYSLVSEIYINKTNQDGGDMENLLPVFLTENSKLYIQDRGDALNYVYFDVLADIVDSGSYFTVSVSFIQGTGTLPTSFFSTTSVIIQNDAGGGTIPNAAYNVVGGVKMSRDSASSTTYISFDGTDTPNVT